MGIHAHGIGHSLEVVETVLEVADVAWNAIEHRRHASGDRKSSSGAEEVDSLISENLQLRSLLEENLNLLQQLSYSPTVSRDCPRDLYSRLVATVDSLSFLTELESLHQSSKVTLNNNFPFTKATGDDLCLVEVLVSCDQDHPSRWVWVTKEMASINAEELSEIDNESYVIVNEEQVVDGVATFVARCILSNPNSKKLTPEELQKTIAKALGGLSKWEKMDKLWHAGKLIYALSTWGIALAGLYRHRAILKAAANGIGSSTKFVLKAL